MVITVQVLVCVWYDGDVKLGCRHKDAAPNSSPRFCLSVCVCLNSRFLDVWQQNNAEKSILVRACVVRRILHSTVHAVAIPLNRLLYTGLSFSCTVHHAKRWSVLLLCCFKDSGTTLYYSIDLQAIREKAKQPYNIGSSPVGMHNSLNDTNFWLQSLPELL